MAKFSGEVGYGLTVEKARGVWEDEVTERRYFGDVVRNLRRMQAGDQVNDEISVSNSISIVADEFANGNFMAIRYVKWAGTLWTVTTVEVQSPRLLLQLGGVYNGPTP